VELHQQTRIFVEAADFAEESQQNRLFLLFFGWFLRVFAGFCLFLADLSRFWALFG